MNRNQDAHSKLAYSLESSANHAIQLSTSQRTNELENAPSLYRLKWNISAIIAYVSSKIFTAKAILSKDKYKGS